LRPLLGTSTERWCHAGIGVRQMARYIMMAEKVFMANSHCPIILCVDDEPQALRVRKLVLEFAGYQVVLARDAASALKTFQSRTIDLVISDHLLPDTSGVLLAFEMKKVRPFVPVIIYSRLAGFANPSEHVDLFISKAVQTDEFLQQVAGFVGPGSPELGSEVM
jgi:DNA-binding NtrC family response regulator